jgi:hypothetical protein
MAAGAEGGVDVTTAGLDRQVFDCLVQKNRGVE